MIDRRGTQKRAARYARRGRPPKGAALSFVGTRVSVDTHDAVIAHADRAGQSVSAFLRDFLAAHFRSN